MEQPTEWKMDISFALSEGGRVHDTGVGSGVNLGWKLVEANSVGFFSVK